MTDIPAAEDATEMKKHPANGKVGEEQGHLVGLIICKLVWSTSESGAFATASTPILHPLDHRIFK